MKNHCSTNSGASANNEPNPNEQDRRANEEMMDRAAAEGMGEWPEPEPLVLDEGTPEEFPLSAFPAIMKAAATSIREAQDCPLAMACASVLAAANFSVHDHFDVEFAGGRFRPISLNMITVAESGARKSSVDDQALKGLRDEIEEKRKDYAKREKEIAEAEKNNKVRKNGEKKDDIPTALPDPNIILGNGTLQGIFRTFAQGVSSLALLSDEGGEFLGGYSMKSENRLASLAGLSKFWDGGTQTYTLRGTEKKAETLVARNCRLSVHLQGQSVAMQPFLADRMARGQGTLARFLIHKPTSTIGTRVTTVEKWMKPADTPAMQAFSQRVRERLSAPHAFWEDGETIKRFGLPTNKAAVAVIVNYYNHLESSLLPGAALEGLSDLANKNHENAARIAATLAAFDGRDGVDGTDMKAGCDIAAYFLSETIRLARLAPLEEGTADALKIARWLYDRGGRESNTTLNNGLPIHLRRKKARAKPMQLLEEAGWVRKDGSYWMLNPKIPASWLNAAKSDEGA
jgi:hypothetical protein